MQLVKYSDRLQIKWGSIHGVHRSRRLHLMLVIKFSGSAFTLANTCMLATFQIKPFRFHREIAENDQSRALELKCIH